MTVKWPPTEATASNMRLCISNDVGLLLNMHMYKEAMDPLAGILRFCSAEAQQVRSMDPSGSFGSLKPFDDRVD